MLGCTALADSPAVLVLLCFTLCLPSSLSLFFYSSPLSLLPAKTGGAISGEACTLPLARETVLGLDAAGVLLLHQQVSTSVLSLKHMWAESKSFSQTGGLRPRRLPTPHRAQTDAFREDLPPWDSGLQAGKVTRMLS